MLDGVIQHDREALEVAGRVIGQRRDALQEPRAIVSGFPTPVGQMADLLA
jgi:hypothetical protein